MPCKGQYAQSSVHKELVSPILIWSTYSYIVTSQLHYDNGQHENMSIGLSHDGKHNMSGIPQSSSNLAQISA